MPIGSLNPLTFLAGSTAPVAARASDKDTDASIAAARNSTGSAATAVPPSVPGQDAAGVILSLQSDATAFGGATVPKDLVYSNGRKPASAQDSDADAQRMALQHSQAMERSATSSSSLSVDKNGVLLAIPATAAEVRAQEFVHHAVTAMRDYADTQERLKTTGKADDAGSAAPTSALIPRGLAEVQKLAARFKLFA